MEILPSRHQVERKHEFFWAVWALLAAFGSYFSMYAFRKPFTAAGYAETSVWGIGFKTVLVTSQVAGYMVSKFLGIKIIAEMPPQRRAISIMWLVLFAEFSLVLFGLIPRPWNAVCLFMNGLPLGMVFGLVLGLLEGRRLTEALTAGLCASFILADGVTKSVGAYLLEQGIPEDWMPSVAGALFLLPLGLCVAMLARIPPPNPQDIKARAKRFTMSQSDRWSLMCRYAFGLIPIILVYLSVTILRSIRADFAPEIWRGLGKPAQPGTFTRSEILVALGVLAINGGAVLIRDNRRAFLTSLATCGVGFGLLAVALLARQYELIGGFGFMVLIGLGFYLPYVAIHTTVFERLLAMTRDRGNIGFLMYVADSIGYLGYVIVMLSRNAYHGEVDFLGLLTRACWLAVGLATVCLVLCWRYFAAMETPVENA
ncbi:DUF5690 family protein [Singulisphaera sp. GP187]|uniref:DUF5690 family protein n=1 Tax=Singulisphaera sp. GP187 TaxID=1882752 RepID=UPI001C1F7559|nr:DUF5690 family protein [Singulisphaera sp. GP187]